MIWQSQSCCITQPRAQILNVRINRTMIQNFYGEGFRWKNGPQIYFLSWKTPRSFKKRG